LEKEYIVVEGLLYLLAICLNSKEKTGKWLQGPSEAFSMLRTAVSCWAIIAALVF
jgi:hypothetical protein